MPEIKIETKTSIFDSKLPLKTIFYTSLGTFIMIAFYVIPTNIAILFQNNEKLFSSPKAIFESKEEFVQNLEKGKISTYTVESFKNMGIEIANESKLIEVEKNKKWKILDNKTGYIIVKNDNKLDIYKETQNKSTMAGYALSTMSFFSMMSSYILKTILGIFAGFSAPVSILLMAAGFLLLGNAENITTIFAAVILIGFSAGMMMPILNLKIQKITDVKNRAFAMALVGCFISLGQFLSPIVLKLIENIFNTSDISIKFKVFALCIFVFAIMSLFLIKKEK